MRMYRLMLCSICLVLGALTGRGQRIQPPYAILLSARNGTNGADFRINVVRKADFLYLRYGRLDSVQEQRLRADPHYNTYASALETNQLPAAERNTAAKRLLALFEQYKVYRWDSLRVATSTHPPFVQLLDSVFTSSSTQLERAEANRGRIVLDGTLVHVVVQTWGHTDKDLFVDSPSHKSHPQLYRLLHETLQLYRQEHPVSFLDPRFTSGY